MGFLGEVFVPWADCHCLVDVWLCFLRGTFELVGQEISYPGLEMVTVLGTKRPAGFSEFFGAIKISGSFWMDLMIHPGKLAC